LALAAAHLVKQLPCLPAEQRAQYFCKLLKEEEERKRYAKQVGADGWTLLSALDAPSTADWMKTLPAVSTLRTSLRPPI
ncbi:MAG TPA: hypothetical protein VF026_17585, partial [Ktedonobacteraceae bacterium]|jgi:hypothetical protein